MAILLAPHHLGQPNPTLPPRQEPRVPCLQLARRPSARLPVNRDGNQGPAAGATGKFLRGAVCGNAPQRVPRPPADPRRTAPSANPVRVRSAEQRPPPPPGPGNKDLRGTS